MRIGIDGHHLNGKPQGSRTYLIGLISELTRIAPEDQFLIYSFAPQKTKQLLDLPNLAYKRVFPETARIRLPFVIPVLELMDRVGVFHSQYIIPPVSAVPEVVTIHDILFETHPDLFVGAFSQKSVWLIRRSARRARFVVTVSEFSRTALLEHYRLADDRVVVTPNGVDHGSYKPMAPGPELDRVKARYRLEAPFVLNVGRLEPRKNLERLIRAFHSVRRKLDRNLELVIAGQDDFGFEAIYREAERAPEKAIRFLGPVPDGDLPALYNLASVFAYPSLVEGFGMPVLEAMACGTPVVSSQRGSLGEVGGDAALWVEPEDEESVAAGLETALNSTETSNRLTQAGIEQSKLFRWEDTAKRTLEVYRKSID